MDQRHVTVTFAVCGVIALMVSGCGSGEPESVDDVVASELADNSSGKGNLLGKVRDSGTIRVANTQVNPPFSFVDESNDVVGFDVDVTEELADRLGIDKVEYVSGTFQTFIPGLQSDKWDAVIAGLTITEERESQVDFSCPYLVNDISVFAASGSDAADGLDDEEDLVGKRVAVTAGGVQEEQVSEISGVDVLTYDNATLALRDVDTGRADLYIGAKFTGAYLAEKNDLDVEPVDTQLEGLLASEITAMAFPKGQQELTAAANKALAGMIEDGTLSKLSRDWFAGLDMVKSLEKVECS